jgi:hypothetical protein
VVADWEERRRGERCRWVYDLLKLRVVAHKDGTLSVSGAFGGRELAPMDGFGPRELPPPADPIRGASPEQWRNEPLSSVSDTWESLDAVPDPA